MNTVKAWNFIRSANAPVIKAGVMTANMHWKATKASSGIVPFARTVMPMPVRPTLSKEPIKPLISEPKVMA